MSDTKLSAIIVGKNESKKLKACLSSLRFCDEILYGDLSSIDDSVEIAKRFKCTVFEYEKYGPSCEYTQADLIKHVSNDWVIMIDPDEVVDKTLAEDIKKVTEDLKNDTKIGDIYVPWRFYFGSRKLRGTVWGYNKSKGIIINRNRYEILPITHYGRRLKSGFKSHTIVSGGENVLHHYWMDDFRSFIAKHKRYLKDEGLDRYNLGQRISLTGVIYNSFYSFIQCFFLTKGYKDGFTGLFLSFFWSWYSTKANFSLYKIAKQKGK